MIWNTIYILQANPAPDPYKKDNPIFLPAPGAIKSRENIKSRLTDAPFPVPWRIGVQFGKDSNAYEKAGGVRKSERKKPVRKPKTTS